MQQQQHADYDLLAVFSDETRAEAAATKLRKEGFSDEEVQQLPGGLIGSGQFREHGPNRSRSEFFLQTQRTGPRPLVVLLFAILFGFVLAALLFLASFAVHALIEPTSSAIGALIGVALGVAFGLLQRGRVRGAIGQNTVSAHAPPSQSSSRARTVVALRFPDPENISRKSRARAILLNNGGKIDRSVGRQE